MTQTDIIIITVGLFTASTLGVYATLRYINQHTRPPLNTLLRSRGDIELQYIEPSTNNTLDLLQPEQVYTPGRIPDYLFENYSERIPSEVITNNCSSNPPSYHTLDLFQQVYIPERITSYGSVMPSYQTTNVYSEDSMNLERIPFNINSCLEDTLNINYTLFIFIFIVMLIIIINNKIIFLTLINKLLHSYIYFEYMIILAILALIHFQFGFLVLTQISILFLTVILSNTLLGLNPYEK
jgi:hypothetical protein